MKLRIFSGILKFKSIQAPKTRLTRPATSRLRQVIFDSISPHIKEAHILDLFAGSGMLAIEAISLGASRATMIEIGSIAFKTIQKNIASLGIKEKIILKKMCGLQYLRKTKETFDIIFLDPPYTFKPSEYNELLQQIKERQLLNKNGIIILEIHTNCGDPIKAILSNNFTTIKEKKLGSTLLLILSLM